MLKLLKDHNLKFAGNSIKYYIWWILYLKYLFIPYKSIIAIF